MSSGNQAQSDYGDIGLPRISGATLTRLCIGKSMFVHLYVETLLCDFCGVLFGSNFLIKDFLKLAQGVAQRLSLWSCSHWLLAPICKRISGHLCRLFDAGFRPSYLHRDILEWRPRKYNKKADFLVNYTMDERSSCHQGYALLLDNVPVDDVNYIVHFDGCSRGESCSGSAWVLEAVVLRAIAWSVIA